VLLGMSVAADEWGVAHGLIAGGIGTYIAGVTWFARTEARRSNRLSLAMALVVILAGIALLGWFPRWIDVPLLARQADRWPLLMTVLGLLIGWRCFVAILEPAPPRVQAAVKQGIFSLVILDAAVCYTVHGTFGAVAILLLLAPAMVLGQWVEST
jgi:4-hydroxybenzoate polyprenyltransferase